MAPEISEIATALGDENARKIGEIFAQHRDRLKQLVEAKLAARPDVRRRFDADDVLQEAFFVINRRFAAFDAEPTMDPKFSFSMRIHTTCWILAAFGTGSGGAGAAGSAVTPLRGGLCLRCLR